MPLSIKRFLYKYGYYLLLTYWYIFRPQTVGVKCLIVKGNKILLIKNTYGSTKWTLPGGGVKKGELLAKAVKREVKEELGINVSDIEEIGSFSTTREYKRDEVYLFAARKFGGKISSDDNEIFTFGWFFVDNLPKGLSEQVVKAIDLYKH